MLKDPLIKNLYEIFKKVQHYILYEKIDYNIIGYNIKNDVTKGFDLHSEQIIVKHILKHFPQSRILSEESGFINQSIKNPEYTFIIDPIDGSNNLCLGIPILGSSIAVVKGNKEIFCENIDYAFIGNLVTGDYFTAIKGQGTLKNNKAIESFKNEKNNDLSIIFHLNNLKYYSHYHSICKHIFSQIPKIQHIRSLGSSVIELSYIIEGKFFAYLDLRGSLTAENFLAAYLLLNECGGLIQRIFPQKPFSKIEKLNDGFSIIGLSNKVNLKYFEKIIY